MRVTLLSLWTADASGSGLIGPPLDDVTNCPSFSQMSYEISVPETFLEGNISRPGLGFLSVSCSCSNTTELMYTLIMGEDLVPFAIDLTTGALSVTDDLDFETMPSYNFTVVCLVPNNLLLNDTATVTVNLLPVNEHRPTIDSQEVITMITEFTTPGLLRSTLPGVAYIVTDEDQPSENLFYTLRDGVGAGLFFNETDGGMYLLEPFDPDAAAVNGSDDCTDIISHFSFRITVCDLDPPSDLCPTVLLQFVQLYSNDNEPTFTEEELSVDVGESTPVNTTLATVTCTDMDVCEGTLSGMEIADENMTSQFSIDSTGTIRNLQAFDFEDTQAREFNISVRCFDSGIFSQTRESFGTVRLQILDENDNAPTCSDSLVTTNITAGTHSSTKLPLQLLCEDRDEGLNSLLTFTLNQQHPPLSNGQFIVDPRTGNLSFTGELPNIDNVYTLYVTITDSGSPRMSTSVEVRVRVLTTPEPVLPMFVVIVIAVIGGLLLLLCLLLTCLCLCWLCGCSCCSRRTVKKTL